MNIEQLPTKLMNRIEDTIKTRLLTNFSFSPSLFQKKKNTVE